tara:strand:- start:1104 stop:1442 length:339 start_codon:yes stop_codon:yes gene_type:complete
MIKVKKDQTFNKLKRVKFSYKKHKKIQDPNDYEELLEIAELKESITKLLDTLQYREREIIKDRYGLNGRKPLTLLGASKKYKVNRERIRQIEARGIRKLQHPIRKERLIGFL